MFSPKQEAHLQYLQGPPVGTYKTMKTILDNKSNANDFVNKTKDYKAKIQKVMCYC